MPEKNVAQYFKILEGYTTKYNLLKTNIYRIDFRNENKVFLASNKNVEKYEPTPTQYVVYRENYIRDDKYRNIITNAFAKIK